MKLLRIDSVAAINE